jgi:hypothetical protein
MTSKPEIQITLTRVQLEDFAAPGISEAPQAPKD